MSILEDEWESDMKFYMSKNMFGGHLDFAAKEPK